MTGRDYCFSHFTEVVLKVGYGDLCYPQLTKAVHVLVQSQALLWILLYHKSAASTLPV